MFSSSNKTKPAATAPQLDSDFGSEFIHTMKDDLVPASSVSSKKNFSSQEKTSSQKGPSSLSPMASSSPFLNPTESLPATSPKNIPTENSQKDAPKTPVKTIPPAPKPLEVKSFENKPAQNTESPFPIKNVQEKPSSAGKVLIIFIVFLIVGIVTAGAYYFWTIKNPSVTDNATLPAVEQIDDFAPDTQEEQVIITPVSEKYSYENPNFLPINIELSSSEEIQRIVSSTAEEIGNIQTKIPFEFIVTDSNSNPMAFPIFSVASNLNLSSELLASLEENFSFFIHNEQGKVRTGIAIKIKNKNTVLAEMLKQESTLTESLSFLFLSKPTISEKIVFKSGEYNGVQVRFFNLEADDDSTSIDYGVYDDKLIIATSKNTMWAIIDKIVGQKIQFQSNPDPSVVGNPMDNSSTQTTSADTIISGTETE